MSICRRGMPGVRRGVCLMRRRRPDEERLLLCQSNLLRVPDLSGLITAHQEAGADMTMAICPDGPAGEKSGDWADGGLVPFVLCNRSILETVPSEGYCDLNEGLLPQLIRAGKVIQSFRLAEPVGSFHGWRQYLEAVGGLLQLTPGIKPGASMDCLRRNDKQNPSTLLPSASCLLPDVSPVPDRPGVWAGREVRIHPTAKILGPVVLSDRVQIAEKAILIGPCILGPGSSVGVGSVISASVTWDGVQIGPDCRIANSVLTHQVNVPRGSVIEGQLHLRPSALEKHPKRLARMADILKESLVMDGLGGGQDFRSWKGVLESSHDSRFSRCRGRVRVGLLESDPGQPLGKADPKRRVFQRTVGSADRDLCGLDPPPGTSGGPDRPGSWAGAWRRLWWPRRPGSRDCIWAWIRAKTCRSC